jgi:hypothetical protein
MVRFYTIAFTACWCLQSEIVLAQDAVDDGYAVPHFYLPTHRKETQFGFFAWIIPLAPFVLFGIAAWRAFLAFWRDCMWAIDRWRDIKRPPELHEAGRAAERQRITDRYMQTERPPPD